MLGASQIALLSALSLAPGYIFSIALLPAGRKAFERIFYSFFFSFAVVPGLLLAEHLFFSVSLSSSAVIANLVVFVLASLGAAFYRIR